MLDTYGILLGGIFETCIGKDGCMMAVSFVPFHMMVDLYVILFWVSVGGDETLQSSSLFHALIRLF